MTFDAVGNPNPKEQGANIPFDGGYKIRLKSFNKPSNR